jgi:hypothetical protein
MRAIILVAVTTGALTGCLRSTQFQCDTDSSCGAGGVCEANNYCSFVDQGCPSGRKYSDSAGPNAGKCTDGNMPQIDGGIDGSTTDGPKTDGAMGCPQDFATVPNAGTHVYKVITTADTWSKQQMACRSMSNNQAYLAVPDNQAELTATDGLTGVGAAYWLGINDIQQETVFVRVYDNQQQGFLPWAMGDGEPDDTMGGQDCVDSHSATHLIYTDKCNDALPAVCECNP